MIQKKIKGLKVLYIFLLCTIPVVHIYVPKLPLNLNLINVCFLGVLFTFSWLFVHIRVESDPKRFVGNFMIMTVLQFLAFLIYELILLFNIGSWAPIIHALILCIVLVVLQAIVLSQSRKLESS
jgi:fatty acid desaturase